MTYMNEKEVIDEDSDMKVGKFEWLSKLEINKLLKSPEFGIALTLVGLMFSKWFSSIGDGAIDKSSSFIRWLSSEEGLIYLLIIIVLIPFGYIRLALKKLEKTVFLPENKNWIKSDYEEKTFKDHKEQIRLLQGLDQKMIEKIESNFDGITTHKFGGMDNNYIEFLLESVKYVCDDDREQNEVIIKVSTGAEICKNDNLIIKEINNIEGVGEVKLILKSPEGDIAEYENEADLFGYKAGGYEYIEKYFSALYHILDVSNYSHKLRISVYRDSAFKKDEEYQGSVYLYIEEKLLIIDLDKNTIKMIRSELDTIGLLLWDLLIQFITCSPKTENRIISKEFYDNDEVEAYFTKLNIALKNNTITEDLLNEGNNILKRCFNIVGESCRVNIN